VGCLTDEGESFKPPPPVIPGNRKIDSGTGLRKACDSWTQGLIWPKKILTFFGISGMMRAGLS
jgi:hypothetical protein